MFDGISAPTLFFTFAASVVILGRRDLPSASRHLGRFAGRTVTHMRWVRQRSETFLEDVQREVRERERVLRPGATRSEAYKVTASILNPKNRNRF